MYIVLLKFSAGKARASQFMDAHKAWIQRGFSDGVFLLTGSLQPQLGGGILAHHTSLADLQRRVSEDPFVAQDIVSADIIELSPALADDRLAFLLSGQP